MAVSSIGSNLGRSGQRAKDLARDRLTQGPQNNQDRNRGFLGNDEEPTEERGLLEAADAFLQQEQTPSPALRELRQVEGVRHEGDERPLLRPSPAAEEEEIIPGDPNNLGARGRRRRSQDDPNASPVLRRGLLGV